MSTPFTHKKLTDVKDSAPEVRDGGGAGGAVRQGRPRGREDRGQPPPAEAGERSPFGHKHEDAEEVYSSSPAPGG